MPRLSFSCCLFLLEVVAVHSTILHQWAPQEKILLGNEGDNRDRFGVAVDLKAGRFVIGADGDDDRGSNAGAVYLYVKTPNKDEWKMEQKLLPNDGFDQTYQNDNFGASVALTEDGTRLAVGSPLRDSGTTLSNDGAVYIFSFNAATSKWEQKQTITSPTPGLQYQFGVSVHFFNNETLVIGEPGDGDDVTYPGSVYVFKWDTGTMQYNPTPAQLITVSGLADKSRFGSKIGSNGAYMVVGAYLDDAQGADSGSAFLYSYDGTTFGNMIKLVPQDVMPNDQFGYAITMAHNWLMIGSPYDDDNFIGNDAGSVYAYLFANGVWTLDQKITRTNFFTRSNGNAENEFFGSAISIDGSKMAIGAPGADSFWFSITLRNILRVENAGAVYVYKRRGGKWVVEDRVSPCEEPEGDSFGYSVSIDMSVKTLVVGSLEGGGRNAAEENPGAAYIFKRYGFQAVRWLLCYLSS